MKLAQVLKAGGSYELSLSDGSSLLVLPQPGRNAVAVEKADDAEEVVYLQGMVTQGRHKGEKARMAVPYAAITRIIIT